VDATVTAGPIHVVATCDAAYAMPLAVMLASLNASLGSNADRIAFADVRHPGAALGPR
jgi:hypothetical protein